MTDKDHKAIERLSKRIKSLRKEKGFTQSELADLMGIEDGNYRKLENGKSNPTYLTLSSLCNALEIDIAEFFSDLK